MAEQELAADNPGKFSIFVKTSCSKTLAVAVSLDDTVRELKAKLNAQDPSLIPDQGMLAYKGRLMEDDLTLRHYEITPNCFLYHRLILRGGGAAIRSALPGKVMSWSSLVQRGWWSCAVVSVGPQLTAWW
ncbi:UBIQP protein, partial [Aramus guarauna]|nr:UBIQP protein [Aramus guarauna]